MNKNLIEEEDEIFYSFVDNDVQVTNWARLPAIVETYTKDATKASNYNDVPASISFFVMLGQLCKDMIAIPSGVNIDDCRIQFAWLQTSGTGKSTLTNWYIPIIREAFERVNTQYGTQMNIFETTDYTDAALIGSYERRTEEVVDDDGQTRRIEVEAPIQGQLDGSGLAMWDEFEASGVFKQSQHKENAVVYLNTFMNTLHGETWIITKKLKMGDEPIECKCERSVYATTYIPKHLTTVIAEKGVLQRLLIFIYEVPQHQQQQMRRQLIADFGTIKAREKVQTKYADSFVKLYECVKERYDAVGGDQLKVIRYDKTANDALLQECILMERYITNSRQVVFEAMETFINRILKHIEKMAVLCCVAEAPSIPDKSKRFIVTDKHVLQASSLIRNCYKSLVSWLDEALREEKRGLEQKANVGAFKAEYRNLIKNPKGSRKLLKDGWVKKGILIEKVMAVTKRGNSTIYKWYAEIDEYFEETAMADKTKLVRLKEDWT